MALGNAVLVRHRLAGECGGLLQQGLHAACQIIAVGLLGQRQHDVNLLYIGRLQESIKTVRGG